MESIAQDIDAGRLALSPSNQIHVECDPQLVESAVFVALRGTEREAEYHAGAEACYREQDIESRDQAFARFNHAWFSRLDLAGPVLQTVSAYPEVLTGVSRCVVAPAIRRSDECAELYHRPQVNGESDVKPCLVIRLRPDSFGRPEHIRALLLHELMHIKDMLDPQFRYDPSLEQFYDQKGVPTLIRDRYGSLWDAYIDGRLFRNGKLDPQIRDVRFKDFRSRFQMLGPYLEEAFENVFEAEKLSHPKMLKLAKNPAVFRGGSTDG